MILEKFNLKDKIALVTGCKRGIGKAIAVALAEAGADIIGVSASLESSGSEVEKIVKNLGRKFKAYACDFSNRSALYSFIKSVKAEFPVIDILINNAGTIRRNPVEDYSDEDWDYVIETNLNAQFILSREIGKDMVKRGKGKIVFTSSLLAFQGGFTVSAYSASKGGISQLTKALSNEWASKGVNINAIAPGYIATDNTKPLRENPARNKAIIERIPQGDWGKPEDLAGAAVFLSSGASDYVNGSTLIVDGGWMGR